MTGLDVEPETFERLQGVRFMRCRFCGQDHAWELVERIPQAAVLMSQEATDCLRRSLLSGANAARAVDADVRELYQRMAGRWFRLAFMRDRPIEPASAFTPHNGEFHKRERPPAP